MALTITKPLTGSPFGPGFMVTVSTDLIGPLPPGSFWEFKLDDTTDEENIGVFRLFQNSGSVSVIWLNRNGGFTQPVWGQTNWTTGDAAALRVRLYEDEETVVEEETVTVVLDRETGQVAELAQFIKDWVPTMGAQLTEEEHNAVLQTNVGVIAMAGFSPLDLAGDIVQAIATTNPLGYGSLSSPLETLTGDGEMPDDLPLLPKWGLYWIASTIPPGVGHRHGQSEEYPSRLVQWRTVHEVGGVEMVTEIVDAQTHGELWRFRFQRPRRLEYSILPGVTIQAAWWQFP